MKFLQLLLFFNALTINAFTINNSNFSSVIGVDDTLINPKETTLKNYLKKELANIPITNTTPLLQLGSKCCKKQIPQKTVRSSLRPI